MNQQGLQDVSMKDQAKASNLKNIEKSKRSQGGDL